jgi:acyl-CoA dehydrogenase
MATALTPDSLILNRRISAFAETHIAPHEGLHREDRFPKDLWKAMAREGLLSLAISRDYGGEGRSNLDLSLAAHSLVRGGHNLGMALSFLIHHIVARHIIETSGSESQKKRYLPDLAAGKITACMAVSEPGIGPHPKHLKSTAEKSGEGFLLTGQKTYLTNGPIADLFVIIAVTGQASGWKRFSAFIVPKDNPGLEVLPPLSIPFFKPAPHGSIHFEDCAVPAEALLGTEGSAYEDLVLPMRRIEDVLMMGAVTGALEKQTELLTAILRSRPNRPDEALILDLGKLKTMLDTAKILSYEAASMLDSGIDHPDQTALHLFFRNLARDFHIQLEIILNTARIDKTGLLEGITNDLAASGRLGAQMAKIRQIKLGADLLADGPDA